MEKASRFSELLRRHKESGLSVSDFCSNEDIPTSTFYYWKRKLRSGNQDKGFIPLLVKTPEANFVTKKGKASRQALSYQQEDEDTTLLELVYPNGTLLRIKKDLDLAHLRALINLYD